MSKSGIAAEKIWFAVSPEGVEVDVVVSVGVPTRGEHGEWYSNVSMGLLDQTVCSIAGIDSWQAVGLAMRFVETQLRYFTEDGWRFYWSRGGELATLKDFGSA